MRGDQKYFLFGRLRVSLPRISLPTARADQPTELSCHHMLIADNLPWINALVGCAIRSNRESAAAAGF
jgi:hypothetical protein